MIANCGRNRLAGASSFGDAVGYVTRDGELARDHETPLAVWSENVSSIETAPLEMQATASQSRAEKPLYHLIVSWDETERPTYEQAREALDTQLQHLGFEGLQYVAALQDDGVGGKVHVHAIINRVDPIDHVARDAWKDRDKMRAACRETERDQGWRSGETSRRTELSHGARDVEYFEGKRSFERRVREEVGPAVRAVVEGGGSWADVHRVAAEHGTRYDEVTRQGQAAGGRLCGSERGEYARARELGPDLAHPQLIARLGRYEPALAQERLFAERCATAAADVAALRETGASWGDVHAACERHDVSYERYRTGARLTDTQSPETARTKDYDRKLGLGEMTAVFGAYESSQAIRDREAAREAVRHAESLVLGAQLIADPSPLLERLTAHDATFTLRSVERVVDEKVRDVQQRSELVEAVIARSVELRDERGKTRFTTSAVLEVESTAREAAQALASAPRDVAIARPAGEHLDEQQRRAYEYAVADDTRLKVVTGVPGAGKTTLISDVAAAYRDAGYNVRAVSIANSAVDVLRRETDVPAQSVAKQLYEWEHGRERLGERDLLIVDEASTLGTAQGAALLKEASNRGAAVLALGDDKQFQAVAHGDAFGIMRGALGENSVDLQTTRRQREGWQREATHAVRRGDVRDAIEAYREHDAVHELGTQADARAAVVARWREIEQGGVECGIEAYTNRERTAANGLARDEWRAMGRLEGSDRVLETIDGPTAYAVGDRVVIRETIREAGLFNGSVGVVRGIEGEALQIERRDGAIVTVDTREHQGVQHAYCSTEYREQGSTRHAELQLVTEHVGQRSLTVGMTRHTHEYEMFYSREAVGSFDNLVALGERTRLKELASDLTVVERQQQYVFEEVPLGTVLDRATEIATGRSSEPFEREERRVAFALRNELERFDRNVMILAPADDRTLLAVASELITQIRVKDAQEYHLELERNQGLER